VQGRRLERDIAIHEEDLESKDEARARSETVEQEEEEKATAETRGKTQRDRGPQPNGPIVRTNVLEK